MLFSGGGGSSTKPKKEEKKERKCERDDRYEIQEAVFIRWANYLLEEQQQQFVVIDLKDLSDIRFLSTFAYIISGSQINLSGNRFDDVDIIFHELVNDDEDKLLQLCIPDICDGNQKAILAMIWQFIQIYWRRFAPPGARERKVAEGLKTWCLEATAIFREVIINDFTSSWRDGIALNILIMSYDENLVDLKQIRGLRGDERIENALNLAKREFKVPKLFVPKEFHSEHLDMKSVVCYLMTLYLAMVSSSANSTHRNKANKKNSISILQLEELQAQQLVSHKGQRSSTSSSSSLLGQFPLITTTTTTATVPVQVFNPPISAQHSPPTSGSPLSRQFTPPKVHSPKLQTKSSFSYTQSPLVGGGGSGGGQSTSMTQPGTPPFIPQGSALVISPLANKLDTVHFYQQQQLGNNSQLQQQQQQNLEHQQKQLIQKQPQPILTPSLSTTNSTVSSAITIIDTREMDELTMDNHNNQLDILNEMRSRKSSSSSQKSSTGKKSSSRGRKHEEILREYEQCLEQVLTWLLEAEHEMQVMGVYIHKNDDEKEKIHRKSVNDDLETVKRSFREHEQFMKSLTESQDSVGRVLLRGQQLSHKLDEEMANGILNQLVMVNERWENIRSLAMERQQVLQSHLNTLQRDHLKQVIEWLTEFEKITNQMGQYLSDDSEVCRQHIAAHTQIQEQIDAQQHSIQRLSSFVAVVDSGEENSDEQNISQLESLLQNVGERWMAICEWAETRTKNLDGLAELLDDCHSTFDYLNEWLIQQQTELENLRSAHHLKSEEEVLEQMRLLRKMEAALETEHASFVRLSQLCSELVQRFENGKNTKIANKIRLRLDNITQIWDNIVTRLEEHSQMLVRTGKTKLCESASSKAIRREHGGSSSSDSSSQLKKKTMKKEDKIVKIVVDSVEQKNVDEFIEKVQVMEREIRDLVRWTNEFSMSPRREDARQMVKICHKKLNEIKKVEPNVTRLQIELEKIHSKTTMNTKQLHSVNETFDYFMQKWSMVVSKISDALNMLTNSPSGSDENEVELIISRINLWLKSANQIMDEVNQLTANNNNSQEGVKRVKQIAEQLTEHQRYVTFLKRTTNNQQKSLEDLKSKKNLEQLEADLLKLMDKIEDFRQANKLPKTTTVVQFKHQQPPLPKIRTSDDDDDDEEYDSSSISPSYKQQHKPNVVEGDKAMVTSISVQQPHNLQVPKKSINEQSPEPIPHEAESLRNRLELEAKAEAEEIKRQTKKAQNDFCNWLQQKEDALKIGQITPGDLDSLQNELDKCNSLIAEIKSKKIGDEIINEGEEALRLIKNSMSKLLKSAETKRNNIVDSINKTQLALHKFVKAEEFADKHVLALEKLKSITENDLSKVEADLKNLRDIIFTDEAIKVEAISFLDDIISIANISDLPNNNREKIIENMRSRTNKLENQWKFLIDKLDGQIVELQNERRRRAENTVIMLSNLVKQLEDGVKASADATDAEELSEHLDNLERILEKVRLAELESTNNGSWLLLNELAMEANSVNKDSTIIEKIQNLQQSYDEILPIARERCDRLRQAVIKCDYFEQALCNCQSWCSHMNHILNLRITSDIHSLDIPHEYKKAFESGTLIPQMDKEFEEYDKLIKELDDFIEKSKNQWSSSDRLHLQSEHAKSQLNELKIKYSEFKQPIILAKKMEKLNEQLNEIESSIDDLTGVQAENCEYCLIHSRQLYKKLIEELGIECGALESFKESIIRNGILNESQTMKIAPKITQLQEKYSNLEQRALATIEKLQRCLNLLEKLNKENLEVENLLTKLEENLQQDITSTKAASSPKTISDSSLGNPQQPTNKISQRRAKLSQLKHELRHALEAIEKAKELEILLRQNSIRLAPNTIEQISNRDNRVAQLKSQLSNWAESLNCEDENSILERFEQLGNELRENLNLIDLDNENPKEVENELKKLTEMKKQFEAKGNELIILSDDEIRRKVNLQLAQIGALWQKHEKPMAPIESPVKSPEMTSESSSEHQIANINLNNTPLYCLNSENLTDLVSPIYTLESYGPNEMKQNRVLPRLDSHSLSDSFNTKNFAESVAEMLAEFQNAHCYLNFNQFPIESLEEWDARLKHLNDWVAENKPKLDDLLAIGKRVAESDRMELVNHEALGHLDELIDLVHKIDSECEIQEELLKQANEKHKNLISGMDRCRDQFNELNKRQIDPAEANSATKILAIQQDLIDAHSQLKMLYMATEELHKSLPGYANSSPEKTTPLFSAFSTENIVLDELNAQLREIEERVQQALVKALQVQETKSLTQPETTQYYDAISVSSGAGLSLAMDVQETEPEENVESEKNYQKLSSKKNPSLIEETSVSVRPTKIQFSGLNDAGNNNNNNLEQFYVNLEAIEDYFEQNEYLPFEGLEEKLQILQDFNLDLERGKKLVQEQQMVMGLAESENILERIMNAKAQLNNRKMNLEQRKDSLIALENLLAQSEQLMALLGIKCEQARRGLRKNASPQNDNERNKSPDLDELESSQLDLEDQLPPLAVHLQQCNNRLENCQEQLSAILRDRFKERLNQLNLDFQEYNQQIRQRRKHLEERLADQTHLNNQLEMLEFWCDETEANITGHVSFINPGKILELLNNVKMHYNEIPEKLEATRILENLKDRFVALTNVEPNVKHEIRRNVAQLAKRISDLKLEVGEKFKNLQEQQKLSDEFWLDVESMEIWIQDALSQLDSVAQAKIYRPSMINIEKLSKQIEERRFMLNNIQNKFEREFKSAENNPGKVENKNQQRVEKLSNEFDAITQQIEDVLKDNNNNTNNTSPQNSDSSENSNIENDIKEIYTKIDSAKNNLKEIEQEQQNPIVGHHSEEEKSELSTEYGTLSSHEDDYGPQKNGALIAPYNHNKRLIRPKMNVEEQARLDTVTRFRSWLQETERDVAITVDIADQNIVRQALNKIQNWIDELEINQIEIGRIIEQANDRLVMERAQLCGHEMEKVLELCQRRKMDLQRILEQSRIWEELRTSIENWLNEANDKLINGGRVNELTDSGINEQIDVGEKLFKQLDFWKEKMKQFNEKSAELLDVYRRDDGHNLSHYSSKLNTQWTKFNDSLRIRRAVLEAARRSRQDFHTVLGQFQQWLNSQTNELAKLEKETNNVQRLKDTSQRKEWMAQEKEAEVEIDAHENVYESIHQMGYKFLEEQQEDSRQREQLSERLKVVENEWQSLLENKRLIKERLENAQEECEKLTLTLSDFLFWTDQQLKTIALAQPVGGDLAAVQKQNDVVKAIERAIVSKDRQVQDCIYLAHSYLMQHDLRPAMHTPSVLEPAPTTNESTSISAAEREERRIGVQILADSDKLKTAWDMLKQQVEAWSIVVASAHSDMEELDRTIAESLLAIGTIEDDIQKLRAVESLRLDELKEARSENADIRRRVHEASTRIDDVNDWTGQITAKNIDISHQLNLQIQAINQRYEKLKKDVGCRGAALERAFNDFGPSSEHFLIDSVQPPWQRAISAGNKLPYYIDHKSENTQWDHPAMVDILEQLCTFNQVKFSAYRTAMKLRALQKRLCLDLIELSELDESFENRLKDLTNNERIRLEDAVMCLVPLFEMANERFPHLLKNVPMALDLALNLLLNIYDPCRDGKLRVLSFKVALVVLCNATLESKYKYLFHLISTSDGVDHKALGVLFYDLIHIPKFFGESAAFGGSNIEPSVRSCFEHSKFPPNIFVDDFLNWLKKEPQSLVWLPVMHRLASSEFAKHQAKCNACKMFPIVGMRYRCLRCFNFDICQNCFFSQRTAKNHKLTHPMQEYCLPTNPRDDMRDFTAMVRNKVRRNRQRVGYLPVEQVEEGQPLEQSDTIPQNAASEIMHQRMYMFAQRLDKRLNEASNAINGTTAGDLLAANNNNQLDNNNKIIHRESGKSVSMAAIHLFENTNNNNGEELEENEQQNVMKYSLNNEQLYSRQKSDGIGNLNTNGGRTISDVKSPSQLMSHVDQMHKEELDQLLQKLQFENLELKQAMEQKRRAAMSFLPNKSAPNLNNNNNNNNNNNRENSPTQQQQQQPHISHYIKNSKHNYMGGQAQFSPQLHPKFSHQQQQKLLHQQQQQMYPPGIYSSAQTMNETNSLMNSSFSQRIHHNNNNNKAMSSDAMSSQTIRQLNPSLLYSSQAVDPIVVGRRPPPSWQQQQQQRNNISIGHPPAIPKHRIAQGDLPPTTKTTNLDDLADQQVLIEARNLRLHQQRLEQRSRVLEEQNRQLQMQLERLNRMVDKRDESILTAGGSENALINQVGLNQQQQQQQTTNMPNWTIPRNAAFSALNKHLGYQQQQQTTTNTHSNIAALSSADETTDGYDSGGGGMTSVPMPVGGVNGLQATELRKNRMDSLMSTVNEMSRAMESFVVSMVANEPIQDEDTVDDLDPQNPTSSSTTVEDNNNNTNRVIKL